MNFFIYLHKGFFILLHVIISFKICRGFSYLFMYFKQNSSKKKLYIYTFNLKNDLMSAFFNILNIIIVFVWFILIINCEDSLKGPFINIFFLTAMRYFTTYADKNYISEINNLSLGYGAALAYYNNYLKMTLTERFSERVDKFNSENMVTLRKKLFILVPESCKVHRYLDTIENENIERCRELPDENITHAGIKNRKYNITVYNVNGLRMAVEFAQPLKAFYLFKEKEIFTKDEMHYQRNLFVKFLEQFKNEGDCKYFEIVEYDDSIKKIDITLRCYYQRLDSSETSYDIESLQNSKDYLI